MTKNFRYQNYQLQENQLKTILITGCNRGIGFEFVRQFSLMDINIIATYRNKSSSEELLSLAEKSSNIEL